MLATFALLGLTSAKAAAPAVALPVVAGVVTFVITAASGAVSIVTNLGNYLGDYEEQLTRVVTQRYTETIYSDYRGLKNMTRKSFWIDPNGESQYLTVIFRKTGSDDWVQVAQNADPFEFVPSWQNYTCSSSASVWNAKLVRTWLKLGYEVPKAARLAKNCAPDPLPVTVFWDCLPLPEDCSWMTVLNPQFTIHTSAPRRTYTPMRAPRDNMMIRELTITPTFNFVP